jgi:hypothetical protein
MAAVLESAVVAPLGYIERQDERPFDFAYAPPAGTAWNNYRSDSRPMRIVDARRSETAPAIAREGFTLMRAATAVKDFSDEAAIASVYYAEAAELARAAVGGAHAYVFDHLVRRREAGPALTFGRKVSGARPSANGRVHNDYTEASGPRRMSQITLPPPQGGGGFHRYAIVNVWRPIKGPVLDAPLALCDARSVSANDLIASDVHYPTRTGEIYLVAHSPSHRWSYFPEMEPQEALVFKQYDSDTRAARFVPHAAFDHPETPGGANPRESIEARVLVVFD